MEKILDIITEKMERAFADAGYDASYGRVTVSNRPDLCEYQCNGALAAAKQYHCAPIQIAKAVAEKLDAADYSLVEAVMPGFINLKLSGAFLETYLEAMRTAPDFGVAKTGAGKTIVVDYGGANVAKPLHIGHLRPAIIGESHEAACTPSSATTPSATCIWATGACKWASLSRSCGTVSRTFPILTRILRENTRPSRPSPCRSLEELYPAASARKKEDEAFAQRAHDRDL